METTIEKIEASDVKTLLEKYNNEAIKLINETVKTKGWRISGILRELKYSDFSNSTKTSRKKFRDRLNRVLFKPTIKNINNLRVDIKVKVSEKEELIQMKRKAWKVVQKEAERLLIEYKNEKGNFYKN